jgi:hypothetical protein
MELYAIQIHPVDLVNTGSPFLFLAIVVIRTIRQNRILLLKYLTVRAEGYKTKHSTVSGNIKRKRLQRQQDYGANTSTMSRTLYIKVQILGIVEATVCFTFTVALWVNHPLSLTILQNQSVMHQCVNFASFASG